MKKASRVINKAHFLCHHLLSNVILYYNRFGINKVNILKLRVSSFLLMLCCWFGSFQGYAYDNETALALPNAYIVSPGNFVNFPVAKAYAVWRNVNELKALCDDLSGDATVVLLWQDVPGLISDITLSGAGEEAAVKVQTSNVQGGGNAVVALNIGGATRWSWHIWVTSYNPENDCLTYDYEGGTVSFMTRNIGAVGQNTNDKSSYGLLYQFGRKEPFVSSIQSVLENNYSTQSDTLYDIENNMIIGFVCEKNAAAENLKNAIENPLIYYYGDTSNGEDWYSSNALHNDSLWLGTNGAKGLFDPSPDGWRVPSDGLLQLIVDDSVNCVTFPYSGSRDYTDGSFFMTGQYGMYWSVSPKGELASYMFLSDKLADAQSVQYRANAYAVRCVKCSDELTERLDVGAVSEDAVKVVSENKSIIVVANENNYGSMVTVFTINGSRVSKIYITSQHEIVADNLPTGVYIVKVVGEVSATSKVLVK